MTGTLQYAPRVSRCTTSGRVTLRPQGMHTVGVPRDSNASHSNTPKEYLHQQQKTEEWDARVP